MDRSEIDDDDRALLVAGVFVCGWPILLHSLIWANEARKFFTGHTVRANAALGVLWVVVSAAPFVVAALSLLVTRRRSVASRSGVALVFATTLAIAGIIAARAAGPHLHPSHETQGSVTATDDLARSAPFSRDGEI